MLTCYLWINKRNLLTHIVKSPWQYTVLSSSANSTKKLLTWHIARYIRRRPFRSHPGESNANTISFIEGNDVDMMHRKVDFSTYFDIFILGRVFNVLNHSAKWLIIRDSYRYFWAQLLTFYGFLLTPIKFIIRLHIQDIIVHV